MPYTSEKDKLRKQKNAREYYWKNRERILAKQKANPDHKEDMRRRYHQNKGKLAEQIAESLKTECRKKTTKNPKKVKLDPETIKANQLRFISVYG
jgi:hypothetical protein